jgi:hypothetical protein
MLAVRFHIGKTKASKLLEGLIPNPKVKLLHQVSEVMLVTELIGICFCFPGEEFWPQKERKDHKERKGSSL